MIQYFIVFFIMSDKKRHGGIIRPKIKRRRLSYKDKRPLININTKSIKSDWPIYKDENWINSGIQKLIPYKNGLENESYITRYVESGKIDNIIITKEGPRCPFDLISEEKLKKVIEISNNWSRSD